METGVKLKINTIILLLPAFALPAEACRCVVYQSPSHARGAVDRADLVFTGIALSTTDRGQTDGPRAVTRFTVQKIFKGGSTETVEIFHNGGPNGGRCGPYLEDGETYLVRAQLTDGVFEAGQCSFSFASDISPYMKAALQPPPPPLCDASEMKIEPQFQFAEEDFIPEVTLVAVQRLNELIPNWVDTAVENGSYVGITEGELGMLYLNSVHQIEGYVLRTKALEERAEGRRGSDTDAFCAFLSTTPIID